MLHHSNYMEAFRIHDIRLVDMSDQDVSMNFLPLTHVFEKAWTYLCICLLYTSNQNNHFVPGAL